MTKGQKFGVKGLAAGRHGVSLEILRNLFGSLGRLKEVVTGAASAYYPGTVLLMVFAEGSKVIRFQSRGGLQLSTPVPGVKLKWSQPYSYEGQTTQLLPP